MITGRLSRDRHPDGEAGDLSLAERADNARDLPTSLLEVRVAQAADRLNEAAAGLSALSKLKGRL